MAKKAESKAVSKKEFLTLAEEYRGLNNSKKEIEATLKKFKPTLKTFIELNHTEKNEKGSMFFKMPDLTTELRCVPKNKSQEEMVAILKSIGRDDCIKMVPNVDEEALETSVMSNEITDKQLESLQNKNYSLYVS
jgi:aspartyl/asparaginyl-tRNA synthetase